MAGVGVGGVDQAPCGGHHQKSATDPDHGQRNAEERQHHVSCDQRTGQHDDDVDGHFLGEACPGRVAGTLGKGEVDRCGGRRIEDREEGCQSKQEAATEVEKQKAHHGVSRADSTSRSNWSCARGCSSRSPSMMKMSSTRSPSVMIFAIFRSTWCCAKTRARLCSNPE